MIIQLYGLFGSVTEPLCTINPDACYGDLAGTSGTGGGLTGFISNVINIIMIAGGLFALFNFVMAGMEYITSQGDPKGLESAKQKIYMSVIGLAIIAMAYTLTAILSYIFFGNFSAILRPTITGPGPSGS